MQPKSQAFIILTQLSSLEAYQQLQVSLGVVDKIQLRKQIRAFKRQLGQELLTKFLDLKQDVTKLWQREANGRPYLANLEIDFNISHAGDWLALIIAPNTCLHSVAIDLESKRVRDFPALIQSLGQQAQQKFSHPLLAKIFPNLEARFYYFWCGHEALSKVNGGGLKDFAAITLTQTEEQELAYTFPLAKKGKLLFFQEPEFYLAAYVKQGIAELNYYLWKDKIFKQINLSPTLETPVY